MERRVSHAASENSMYFFHPVPHMHFKKDTPPVQEQPLSAHCINCYRQNISTHPKEVAKEEEDKFILKRFSMDDS